MCVVKIMGNIDITIEGQSLGLTCAFEEHFGCENEPGSYRIYLQNGAFGVCGPETEYCPLDKNSNVTHKEVFCDPCKPRCTQGDDPQELVYAGQQHWLFTSYVNGAPSPKAIEVYSFEISKRKDKYGNEILVVQDQECCCNKSGVVLEDFKVILVPEKQVDIQEIIKSSQQISIPGGDDPNTVCDCGCPEEAGTCGPKINGCDGVGDILNQWRSFESKNCQVSAN